MATTQKNVKALPEQWERWRRAAELSGLKFNTWIRCRLDEAADLDEAEARDGQAERE